MYKLGLEKAEKLEIKIPTLIREKERESQKNNPRKTKRLLLPWLH